MLAEILLRSFWRVTLLILAFLSVLFSCRQGGMIDGIGGRGIVRPAAISYDSLIDYSGVDTLLFLPDKSVFESVEILDIIRFIKLETNAECLIGSVGKVQFVNGLFYLLDDYTGQNAIHVFDTLGNHVRSLKRIGRGPGEYKDILDFDIDDNRKLFIVNSMGNILEYDSLLKYKRTINLEIAITTISVFHNFIIGISDGSTYKNPHGKLLHILSQDGRPFMSFLEYMGGASTNINRASALTKANGKVYVNIPYSPIIFSIDSALSVNAEYYLFLNYSLSEGGEANRFQEDESKDFFHSDENSYCSFTLPVRTAKRTINLLFSGFSSSGKTFFPVNVTGRLSDGVLNPLPLMTLTGDGIGISILDADYLKGNLNLERAKTITDSTGARRRVYSNTYLGGDTLPGSLYDMIRRLDENDNPCIILVKIKPFPNLNESKN